MLCTVANMWMGAPDIVKEGFKQHADVVNAWEQRRVAEQQKHQHQHQSKKVRAVLLYSLLA